MPVSQSLPPGPFTPGAGTPAPDAAAIVAFLAQKGTATDAELIPLTQKGAANGVATLGADGRVPAAQGPPVPTNLLPINLRDAVWGLVYNGTTDDTAAIVAALNAAQTQGRPVYAPAGRIGLSGRVVIPNGVPFSGAGAAQSLLGGQGMTTFVCLAAGAGINFGTLTPPNRHGNSGQFEIDGANIATQPLFIGLVNDTTFNNIRVDRAAGTSILCEAGQNNTFIEVTAVNGAGIGWKFDRGFGGNVLIGCNSSKCGSSTAPSLLIAESFGTGPYTPGPSANTWVGCIFERVAPGQTRMVQSDAGRNNTFISCIFNAGDATVATEIFWIAPFGTSPAGEATGELRFDSCTFSGTPGLTTAVRAGQSHGRVAFTGLTLFLVHSVGFSLTGNSYIDIDHVSEASVTTFAVEATVNQIRQALRSRYRVPLESPGLWLTDSGALPVPASGWRGKLVTVFGAAGVADKTYVCMKTATDTYVWAVTATG